VAKATKGKTKSSADARKITLKSIGESGPCKYELVDFGEWYSHPTFGRSIPLEMKDSNGEPLTLWLNEKTKAGKAFIAAQADGALDCVLEGGSVMVYFKPEPVPKEFTDGEDRVSVRMRFGKTSHAEAADIPF
jgi:hypothetical protein